MSAKGQVPAPEPRRSPLPERRYRSVVILTGAGMSAESGIATFRGVDGQWENHRIEQVASPEGFAADPELVQEFYNLRRRQLLSGDVQPNDAHRALARLERDYPGEVLVVTQNIDDLHERAGSGNLIHMHGELLKTRCAASGRVFPVGDDVTTDTRCPCCGAAGRLRPHVVWFGEMPLLLDDIYSALASCELFVAIGTSGNVYPAAGFVTLAAHYAAHTIEVNLAPSEVESAFAEKRYGLATNEVSALVDELLAAAF